MARLRERETTWEPTHRAFHSRTSSGPLAESGTAVMVGDTVTPTPRLELACTMCIVSARLQGLCLGHSKGEAATTAKPHTFQNSLPSRDMTSSGTRALNLCPSTVAQRRWRTCHAVKQCRWSSLSKQTTTPSTRRPLLLRLRAFTHHSYLPSHWSNCVRTA